MAQGPSLERFFFPFLAILFLFVYVFIISVFYLLVGFNLFILLSCHIFARCCDKRISSCILFTHMLTAIFFFKGP